MGEVVDPVSELPLTFAKHLSREFLYLVVAIFNGVSLVARKSYCIVCLQSWVGRLMETQLVVGLIDE